MAALGLVVRATVTPPASAPEDESQIAKFAVPPVFTLEFPEKTSTLSHSFTGAGGAAMNAVGIFVPGAGEAGADKPGAGEAGADKPGAEEADANEPGAGEAGANEPGAGETEGAGDGFGGIVAVIHCCAAAGCPASGVEALALPIVTAVVAMTAPIMHKPVAAPVTADRSSSTLIRLTSFPHSVGEKFACTRIVATLCAAHELS